MRKKIENAENEKQEELAKIEEKIKGKAKGETKLENVKKEIKREKVPEAPAVQSKPKHIKNPSYLKHIVNSDVCNEEIIQLSNQKLIEQQEIERIRAVDKQAELEKIKIQEELLRIQRERASHEDRVRKQNEYVEQLRYTN